MLLRNFRAATAAPAEKSQGSFGKATAEVQMLLLAAGMRRSIHRLAPGLPAAQQRPRVARALLETHPGRGEQKGRKTKGQLTLGRLSAREAHSAAHFFQTALLEAGCPQRPGSQPGEN